MNISAKIIADSIGSYNDKRIITYELEFNRYVLSEFNTHRALSRNAASSRAIPITATIQQISENPAMPIHWGENQSGMSAAQELSGENLSRAKQLWLEARDAAIHYARELSAIGLHKQVVNRILEPWVTVKVIATATEWDNFFHLRNHRDAQPEIHELARQMFEATATSVPVVLSPREYHLPYITDVERDKYTLHDCIKLSASLCAQVSYRKSDESIDKALLIYDRLVGGDVLHASPFEHQAHPSMSANTISGNFMGWYQYRQELPKNVCRSYIPHASTTIINN